MLELMIIFVIGVICGILAGQLRVKLMRKKVRLYESYIYHRLGETVPFIRERSVPHDAELPKARESYPEADQRR